MRAPLPPRRWRRLVAATQGIVLTVAAAERAAPGAHAGAAGRRARRCSRCRSASARGGCGAAGHAARSASAGRGTRASPWRSRCSPCCSSGPRSSRRTSRASSPSARSRGSRSSCSSSSASAVLLPAAPRRVLAVVVGRGAGVLVLVKVLDIGFFTAFDRPFEPVRRLGLPGHRRRDAARRDRQLGRERSPSPSRRVLSSRCLALPVLALLRVTRVAAGHRGWALRAAAVLGVVWVALRVAGAPVASSSAAALAVDEVRAVRSGLDDRAGARARDRPRPLRRHARRPAAERPAGQGRPARVRRELREGRGPGLVVLARRRAPCSTGAPRSCAPPASPRAAPSSPRRPSAASAGWRTPRCSPGIRVDGQRRYDQLVESDRLTLTSAFKRAGWRAVGVDAGEPPGVAGGLELLPLRHGLRPPQPRLPRARASACRRCPTSTRCRPCSGSSSPRATGRRCSPRST